MAIAITMDMLWMYFRISNAPGFVMVRDAAEKTESRTNETFLIPIWLQRIYKCDEAQSGIICDTDTMYLPG
jgi:hypothetical protein